MTQQFRKACEQGLACCNEFRTAVEFLEQISAVHPEWRERVAELRSKLDHVNELSEAGINIMDSMG